MKKQILNEELHRMQRLAGVITENEYKDKLSEEMYGWDEGDLTDEELEKVKILMALEPYEDKIDRLNTDEIIPGTDYKFDQIDFDDQLISFIEEDINFEYGWSDAEIITFDFIEIDDELLKSFLTWLSSKGIK